MRSSAVHLAAVAAAMAIAPTAAQDNVFAVLQDGTGRATVAMFNSTGNQVASAEGASWHFRFPLVESAASAAAKQIYSISYPEETGKATLYQFDAGTNPPSLIEGAVTTFNNSFFDLQYSPRQDAFFGIFVNSTYGRVLSEFPGLGQATVNGTDAAHVPIAGLPSMWYVNASSFDAKSDTYFGLLNHFPNTPGATDAQKLAVGNFGTQPGTATFVDLVAAAGSPAGIIHFISWSEPTAVLFGFAQMDAETACFVTIDPATGIYRSFFSVQPLAVGPMVASADQPLLIAMPNNADDGQRLFGTIDISSATDSTADDDSTLFEILQVYPDTQVVTSLALVSW